MKRTILVGIVAALCLAGGIAWYLNHRPAAPSQEPTVFKGQPASYWLEQVRKAQRDAPVLAAALAIGQSQSLHAAGVLIAIEDGICREAYFDLADMVRHSRALPERAEIVSVIMDVLYSTGRPNKAVLYPLGKVALRDPAAAAPAFPHLKKLILDRNGQAFELRWNATFVAGLIAERVPESVPFLLDLVDSDPDDLVRATAINGLARAKQPQTTTPRLIQALTDPNRHVRAAAAQALYDAEPTAQAITALEKAVADLDYLVRTAAETSLDKLKQRRK